jgi:glycosyltransferase involved in cell wall biosynthesis
MDNKKYFRICFAQSFVCNRRVELENNDGRRECVFTIVSNNYLHFAITMLRSFAKNNPGVKQYCFIVDDRIATLDEGKKDIEYINIDRLKIPNLKNVIFKYSILELNTAVKPWCFQYLFEDQYESIIYLDPDINVYYPFTEVYSLLDNGADIVITPHVTSPFDDNCSPSELDIKCAGVYNLGFIALKNTENVFSLIMWWQSKLIDKCVVDLRNGIFVDQSWIDLVPAFFEKVAILKDPGYNVAYWNLSTRSVCIRDRKWYVNERPLVFFHYSGLSPSSPEVFSKHQNRFNLAKIGEAKELVENYVEELKINNESYYSKLKYGFSSFRDGNVITDLIRKCYLRNTELQHLLGNDPFSDSKTLFSKLSMRKDGDKGLTYALDQLLLERPDLTALYNQGCSGDLNNILSWFYVEGHNYFPSQIIENHRMLYGVEKQNDKKIVCTEYYQNMFFIEELYLAVLGRMPDQAGINAYIGKIGTRRGRIAVFFRVLLSRESRGKRNMLKRLAIGISNVSLKTKCIQNANRVMEPVRISGVYSEDIDSNKGAWSAKNVDILFPELHRGDFLEVFGYHDSVYFWAMNRSKDNSLMISIDGRRVKKSKLKRDGQFHIRIQYRNRKALNKLVRMQLTARKVFIPSMIGLGDDVRELSYRLKEVRLNGVSLFNGSVPWSIRIEKKGVDIKNEVQEIIEENENTPNVKLVGYIKGEWGVGEGVRSLAKSLKYVDFPYSTLDVGYQSDSIQRDTSVEDGVGFPNSPIQLLYVNADQTPNTLKYLCENNDPAKYRIGYWHWEQTRLPKKYHSGFIGLNELWVPSSFVQDSISPYSSIPVVKIPHSVEFIVNKKYDRDYFKLPREKFLFLMMYDLMSYHERKNPEAALEAFEQAFRNSKDIGIVVKVNNAEKSQEKMKELRDTYGFMDGVVFIENTFHRDEVYALENACDCFLSLHRAEGFGLGLAEMMYLRKPVVGTGWSGNMEFMTPMNSFLVEYELRKLARSIGVYEEGLEWAEADIEHAVWGMRKIVKEEDYREKISSNAAFWIRRYFSRRAIGEIASSRLAKVWKEKIKGE